MIWRVEDEKFKQLRTEFNFGPKQKQDSEKP